MFTHTPIWLDLPTGEPVQGPSLPLDLTRSWDLALAAMDHGLVRVRFTDPCLLAETTQAPADVLPLLRTLLSAAPTAGVLQVRVVNLRTGQDVHRTTARLLADPVPSPLKANLTTKAVFDYTFQDICDAATLREQHHAVYGSRLRLDWSRLNLALTSKTLTFEHPQGRPHIRWATRVADSAPRLVYLVVGLSLPEVETRPGPWAWTDEWQGILMPSVGPLRPFDFRDPEAVAQAFGDFDLAAVGWFQSVAARAHGWNPLTVPRAWEGYQPSDAVKVL